MALPTFACAPNPLSALWRSCRRARSRPAGAGSTWTTPCGPQFRCRSEKCCVPLFQDGPDRRIGIAFIQAPPQLGNQYADDRVLRSYLARTLSEAELRVTTSPPTTLQN